jgi:sec-independent protein translocase protein TatB
VFDLDPAKLLMLGFLALLILGPHRLPQAARSLGRMIGQLRVMSESFQSEVKDALGGPGETITSAVNELRNADIRRSVRDTMTATFSLSPAPNGPNGSAVPANGSPVPSLPGASAPPLAPDDPSLN